MKAAQVYTGGDRESHFEDIDVPLAGRGHISPSPGGKPRHPKFVTLD